MRRRVPGRLVGRRRSPPAAGPPGPRRRRTSPRRPAHGDAGDVRAVRPAVAAGGSGRLPLRDVAGDVVRGVEAAEGRPRASGRDPGRSGPRCRRSATCRRSLRNASWSTSIPSSMIATRVRRPARCRCPSSRLVGVLHAHERQRPRTVGVRSVGRLSSMEITSGSLSSALIGVALSRSSHDVPSRASTPRSGTRTGPVRDRPPARGTTLASASAAWPIRPPARSRVAHSTHPIQDPAALGALAAAAAPRRTAGRSRTPRTGPCPGGSGSRRGSPRRPSNSPRSTYASTRVAESQTSSGSAARPRLPSPDASRGPLGDLSARSASRRRHAVAAGPQDAARRVDAVPDVVVLLVEGRPSTS